VAGFSMTTDHDIWCSALVMIERYGPNAALEAGDRSDEATARGDIEESEVWQRILAAIERLQAEKPGPGEKVQ
jgi:hypothetical protein